MEKWDMTVLDINATVNSLGERKCKILLAIHALSGSDTTSYMCRKGKITVMKSLPRYLEALEWLGSDKATQDQLIQGSKSFFLVLYGRKDSASLNEAIIQCIQKV